MNRALLILAASAIAGLPFTSVPASAQGSPSMVCGKRADIVRELGEKYGETRRSIGLAQGRGLIEVFASEKTGSWTILITSPRGIACLMAAGESYQPEPEQAPGQPA